MGHSVGKRFFTSIVANVLRSGVAFATALLLARWLGPGEYGRLAFLLASFAAFRQFLDMGSSTAFFTLLSQRGRSRRFVSLYWRWVGLQFLISLALLGFLLPGALIDRLWLGETRPILVLALVAAFMQGTVWPIASQMAEASRETLRVQRLNTIVVLIHLIVVLALWQLDRLAIPLIFVGMALEWALAGWMAAKMYRTQDDIPEAPKKPDNVRSIGREFLAYCLPLIPYAWLGFAHDFADRWMLQHWGGAEEQAYYGISQQFAGVALLATSSILRIFWKEVAEAHHNGDRARVERLYHKVSRLLFFIAAVMAGGLLPWAGEILRITVGDAYAGGATTLMLMFLYPVHQSMGQIGGTMLYATGEVRLQVALGIVFMLVSLMVAYLMMAPRDALVPGLGMASRGLAWKMVVLQLVQVNVLAWFIARRFGWKFDWIFQIGGLLGCLSLGWLAYHAAVSIIGSTVPLMARMLLAGVCYASLAAALIYILPQLAGLTRSELAGHARRLGKVLFR